ncbi:MAG: hypothetical protein ACREGH_01675 [Minisyncoccia bacterium]
MNSNIKIIGIGIFLLVLFLAVVGFFVWHSVPTSQPGEQSTNNTFPGSTSVSVTSGTSTEPSSVVSSATSAPDLVAAYQAIFTKLDAKELTFTAVDASSTDSDIYAFYSSDASISKQFAPAGADLSIEVAMADLNYSGMPEAVVYEDLPGFCGVAGCPLNIYQKENGKWIRLFGTLAATDEIAVSMALTNQYADIFVPQQGAVGSETEIERYVWKSGSYQQAGIVAVWNNNAFETVSQ